MDHFLKIVADETDKASFEMMNSVVVKASQLSLGRSEVPPGARGHYPATARSFTTDSDFTGLDILGRGPSRRRELSEGGFRSTGLSHKGSPSRTSGIHVPSQPVPACSRDNLPSSSAFAAFTSPLENHFNIMKKNIHIQMEESAKFF